MKNHFGRSVSALASVLCCTLGAGVISVSCDGTETDNPVAGNGDAYDGTSPENFSPLPGGVTPCIPTGVEEEPMLPRWLATSVVVPSASGRVLATGSPSGGLGLFDATDPANPVELSHGVVRGELRQLLLASSGELWVLATEPPTVERSELPTATTLDPVLKLVRVDVSDPAQPVRLADVALEGDPWEVRERNGEAWVLSGRRDAVLRSGCKVRTNDCGDRWYEALLLHGFRASGSALEPIGDAELPFEQRMWWGTDGVVTALADGTLHVASWDAAGSLRAPLTVARAGGEGFAGPTEVAGNELSVVRVAAGQARIDVYDLDAGAAAPVRSAALGAHTERAGLHSLFDQGHLWLQAPYGEVGPNGPGAAELWDVTGAAPVRVALPLPFHTVLPFAGASR
ncbi:MAG TPA: hypothetical protein VMG12_29035, partial [Polyangiaceae bacterium]|nr:hypothetical protein [Polyangiaceae bacterium]